MPDFKGRYTKKYRIIGMSRDLSQLLKPEKEDTEDIVWLHTDETEPEVTRKDPWTGEETVICEPQLKQLYDRKLIPDWIDFGSLNFDTALNLAKRYHKSIGEDDLAHLLSYSEIEKHDWILVPQIVDIRDWGRPTKHRTYREMATPPPRRSTQRYDNDAGDTATADEIARALGKI